MEEQLFDCLCDNPKGETERAYKVWNGKSFSYLAKSQMKDVNIVDDIMYFKASAWFLKIHPWIQKIEI